MPTDSAERRYHRWPRLQLENPGPVIGSGNMADLPAALGDRITNNAEPIDEPHYASDTPCRWPFCASTRTRLLPGRVRPLRRALAQSDTDTHGGLTNPALQTTAGEGPKHPAPVRTKNAFLSPHSISHNTTSYVSATNVNRQLAAPATQRPVQEAFLIGSAMRKASSVLANLQITLDSRTRTTPARLPGRI